MQRNIFRFRVRKVLTERTIFRLTIHFHQLETPHQLNKKQHIRNETLHTLNPRLKMYIILLSGLPNAAMN